MNAHIILAVLTFVLSTATAAAETLGEATADALQHSPVLLGEMQRLESTREEMPIAWAEVFPQITLDASAVDSRSTERGVAFTVREQREHWIAGIRTSTLLFGGGRTFSSRRLARAQIAEAVARYQDRMQVFILDVTRAYGDVRQERAIVAAQNQAVMNFGAQRSYVDAHMRHGFLTRTDLAQADSRLANARAELAAANARLVAANEAFLRLVGHPPTDLHEPLAMTGLPAGLAAAQDISARDNPSIVARLAALEASDASVGLAAAQGRLNVRLETNNSTFAAFDQRLGQGEESEDNVAVRVTLPIFAGGAIRARERQQRHLRNAARYDVDEIQRQIRERVAVAWSNLDASRARLAAMRSRVEAAQIAREGVLREQEAGQRSTIDVLDQETELLQASISVAQAERQAMVAERELAAAVGDVAQLAQQAEALPEH